MNTRAARMTHENFQTSHSHLMWYAWKSLINVRNDTVCLVNKSIPFFVDFGMEQNGPICQYIICGRKKNKFWSGIKVEIFRKELTNRCIFKTNGLFMSQDFAQRIQWGGSSDRPWVLYNLLCYSIIICFCIGCLCFIILSSNVWVANRKTATHC